MTYTVKEMSQIVGRSPNLIYRRLTEDPKRYIVRFAHKEGGGWVFDKVQVDEAIKNGESIITREKISKPTDNEESLAKGEKS
jgi:hypothetical protein